MAWPQSSVWFRWLRCINSPVSMAPNPNPSFRGPDVNLTHSDERNMIVTIHNGHWQVFLWVFVEFMKATCAQNIHFARKEQRKNNWPLFTESFLSNVFLCNAKLTNTLYGAKELSLCVFPVLTSETLDIFRWLSFFSKLKCNWTPGNRTAKIVFQFSHAKYHHRADNNVLQTLKLQGHCSL